MRSNIDGKNIEAAKEYVDKQFETMRKYGSAEEVSDEEYRSLVLEIAEAINLK